jgi:N-acetylglucosamine malate deacetylase 1
MNPTKTQSRRSVAADGILVFGAHPDDIEFGCGAVIAKETQAGRAAHFVVGSRGESGTNGTPRQRTAEAKKAAALLGASIELIDLGGDAHFERRAAHVVKLAAIVRRLRPAVVLAPSVVENQHPDHAVLGKMVRDAIRVARYGGVRELRKAAPHAVRQLWFYALGAEAEPTDLARVWFDVSEPAVMSAWTAAMEAHASQMKTRNYAELQLTRARLNGLRAGVAAARNF